MIKQFRLIFTLFLFTFFISHPSQGAGYHAASFEDTSKGTFFLGMSPLYASTTYGSSSFANWGYQGLFGFDHSFSEGFGLRSYVAYGRITGDNAANNLNSQESMSASDLEVGLMGTFSSLAIGGGLLSRSSSITLIQNSQESIADYSGLIHFVKASLDFTSTTSNIGFSLGGSYIFGNLSTTTPSLPVAKVGEWRALCSLFLLLPLK